MVDRNVKNSEAVLKKTKKTKAANYAQGFWELLTSQNPNNDLFVRYMTTTDKAERDDIAEVLKDLLSQYATVPGETDKRLKDKNYSLKIAAMENKLTSLKSDNRTFFAYALKNNPDLALAIIKKFNVSYDYLNMPDVLSFLSCDDVPANQERRSIILNKGEIPTVFGTRVVKGFTWDNGKFFDFNVKGVFDDLGYTQKRQLLRAMVLSYVVEDFSVKLAKSSPAVRDVRAFRRMVANYPDILDVPYGDEGNKAERIVFGLKPQYLRSFFDRAVKMERLVTEDGVQSTYYSGYTVSPEEFIYRSLNYGDEAIKITTMKTADVFTEPKRQKEQVENIAKLAAANPDHMFVIINAFQEASNYESKREMLPKLIKNAKMCGVTSFVKSVQLSLDTEDLRYREQILDILEESYNNRKKEQDRTFDMLAKRELLSLYGRTR